MEEYKTLIGMSQKEIDAYKKYKITEGVASFAGGFADSMIDYEALKINANFNKISADRIELQAEQRANALKEEFTSAVGNLSYSAARRGIASDSGSIQRNIEKSSENLGYNIKTMKDNAKGRADDIRFKTKMAKRRAKTGMISSLIGEGAGLYNKYDLYSSISKSKEKQKK